MKKIMLGIAFTMLSIGFVGCSDNSSNDHSDSSISSSAKENHSIDESSSISDETSIDKQSKNKTDITLNALKKGYSSIANVTYSETDKTFHLAPIEGLSETVTLQKVADAPDSVAHQDALKNMASQLIEMSNMISENVGKGFKISFDNPYQDKKPLFIIEDGNVEYPILTQD